MTAEDPATDAPPGASAASVRPSQPASVPASIQPASPAAIEAAWAAIPRQFRDSPQFESPALSEAVGAALTVKVETLNPIRSFKARGACWFAARCAHDKGDGGPGAGWVTASAGNFGQGLAWAARRRDIGLVVFSATTANPEKLEAMRSLGAEVRLAGSDFDAAKDAAREFAEEAGARFVEDGREPEITEGAGTIALELLRDDPERPSPEALVVPVGNGALIGGMGAWARNRSRASGTAQGVEERIEVIGVIAGRAPVMLRSFEAGAPLSEERAPATCADGLSVRDAVPEAVARMLPVVDRMVAVSEEALLEAVRLLHRTLGLVIEPAGAAGVAAVLSDPGAFRGRRVATPLCGGNLAPDLRKMLA